MKYTKHIAAAALITMMFVNFTSADAVMPEAKAPDAGTSSATSVMDARSMNNALFLLQVQQELKQAYNDYHKLSSTIDQTQEKALGLKGQLGTLREQIVGFQHEIDASQAKIEIVAKEIGLQSKEITLLEEEIMNRSIALEEQKSILADYMRMMYMSENTFKEDHDGQLGLSATKLLLSDANIGQTVQQMVSLDMLQHGGQQMLEKLRKSQEMISSIQESVKEKKISLDAMKTKLIAERDVIEDQKLAKEQLLQVTHGEEQIYQKLISESAKQQDESLLQINALQNNFNYVKENLSKLGNAVGVTDLQKLLDDRTRQIYELQQQSDQNSVLQWPVNPNHGISAFYRDPAYRNRFGVDHQAVDIPTNQGSEIHAPKDGIVYKTKDNGMGYSYIILSHKGQLMTVYGHVSSIMVKEGDTVTAGSVIGLSGGMPGTTGAGYMTTGAHLHFEVLFKGQHVDPLDYLSLSKLSIADLPAKYATRLEDNGAKTPSAVRGITSSDAMTETTIDGVEDPKIEQDIDQSIKRSTENEIGAYKKLFGD